ncbi:MAG: alpha/beta hydrolase [Pseudomonadota bacterium]
MKLSVHRRGLILAATMILVSAATQAEPVPAAEPGDVTIKVWPGGTPGAGQVSAKEAIIERLPEVPLRDRFAEHVTTPLLTMFEPKGTPNGITLLIVPGGGYVRVVIDKEGFEAADWFSARGFTCAVLRYRMPGDGWAAGPDAPVHDAMRSIRILRGQPLKAGETAPHIGVMGFSAGGHVVARLITEPKLAYERSDAIDNLSARPDFAVLMYPVIATSGVSAHGGSVKQLLAAGVKEVDLARFSPDRNVTAGTPPTLLVHAGDDATVPVQNSLLMYAALQKAGVRSELHVFDQGGHGFGLRSIAGKDVAVWPALVESWAQHVGH